MKKLMLALAAAMLLTAVTTALACGSNCGRTSSARYSVCSVQECTQTGLHAHNDVSCYAHYYGDGHDYHGYCDLEDCKLGGYHAHDGEYCFGHTSNDGHSYHRRGGHHR